MRTLAERFMARKLRPDRIIERVGRYGLREKAKVSTELIQPKAILQLQNAARRAHRFVFDEYASAEVAKVIKEMPDLIVREQRWARPPYEMCWIEVNLGSFWDTFHGDMEDQDWILYAKQVYPDKTFTTAEEARKFVNDKGDHLVGFLIDHNRVNTIFGGTREHPTLGCEIGPIQYRLHTEWPEEDQERICKMAGMFGLEEIDMYLWGSSYAYIKPEDRSLLRNTNAVEVLPLAREKPLGEGTAAKLFSGGVGEFRTIVALMLMLNRPSVTRFVDVPPTRGPKRFEPGATRISYTTVHVELDATHVIRKVGTPEGESVPRRRHEVREHYAHDAVAHEWQRDAGCLHNWRACGDNNWTPLLEDPPLSYQVLHWICDDCGGKRWFRHEHERGDESRGRVIHQGYEVTSKKKKEGE